MKYLFVYQNVKEYDILENSITDDVSIFQTSIIELDSIINDVTHIGFMYHTQERFPFQVEQQQVSTIQSYYFHEFMYVLEQLENQNRVIIIDLLTCDFDVEYIKEIQQHFQNLQIRVSTNDTGNPEYGGDWIMEYNSFDDDTSINIRDVFFTANIRNFTVILNANYHHHFIRSDNVSSNIHQTLRYSPDGNRIAVAYNPNDIKIYDSNLIIESSYNFTNIGSNINTLEWNPIDNNNIAFNVDTQLVSFHIDTDVRSIIFHGTNIVSLTWSPDANYIAIVDHNKTLSIYNISLSLLDSSIGGFSNPEQVEWSPDGSKIAVRDTFGLHIFDKDDITSGPDISFGQGGIRSISWSPDSLYILAVSSSEAYMYDISNGNTHLDINSINNINLINNDYILCSGAIHPNAYQFTILTTTHFLFFDYKTGKLEAPKSDSNNNMNNYNLQYSPDGKFMIYNNLHMIIILMHSLTPALVSIIDTPLHETYTICNFIWYANDTKIVVRAKQTSTKSTICIFDISNVNSLNLENRIVLHLSDADISFDVTTNSNLYTIGYFALSPDETKIAFTSVYSRYIYVYNLNNGTQILEYDLSNSKIIYPAITSIRGLYALSWSLIDNDIFYYSVWADDSNGNPILPLFRFSISAGDYTHTTHPGYFYISSIEMSPDYTKLAICGARLANHYPSVIILDPNTLSRIDDLYLGDGNTELSWSPDSNFFAMGSNISPYNIRIFDTSGNLDTSLNGHTFNVRGVSWSPDGQYIVSSEIQVWNSYTYPYIHVFDVTSGEIVHSFFGHIQELNRKYAEYLQWGKNSDRVASLDYNNNWVSPIYPQMVRVWEINPAPRTIQQQDPGHDPGQDPGQNPGQQNPVSSAANPRRRILTTNFGINRTQQALLETIARRTVSSTPAKRKTGIPSQEGSFSRIDYLRQIAGTRR